MKPKPLILLTMVIYGITLAGNGINDGQNANHELDLEQILKRSRF